MLLCHTLVVYFDGFFHVIVSCSFAIFVGMLQPNIWSCMVIVILLWTLSWSTGNLEIFQSDCVNVFFL